ncbi:endochitinase-like [Penaeus japonicus]|uniref:endochitinase-like n=1 Tax=Penaeus japonicus TaxID=27405 RepID=UPI001C7106BD|nr:endochitinase-like [Penaeus japonicus]
MKDLKFLKFLLVVLLVGHCTGLPRSNTNSTGASSSGQAARRVCYFESWAVGRPGDASYTIEDVPAHLCTHVIYAFGGLSDTTWEYKVLNPVLEIDGKGYERFVALKDKYPGVKVIIAVGGWGEGGWKYSHMASQPDRRAIFINSVVQLLKDYGFDGLDMDWEYPGAPERGGMVADKENFRLLMEELRQAFDAENQGWDLSIAVPIYRSKLEDGYDVPALCSVVDAVNLMAYDLRAHWDGFADVHSLLYRRPNLDYGEYRDRNANGGVLLWEEFGCPRNKLVLGTAFYGRTFTLRDPSKTDLHSSVVGAGNPGPYTGAHGSMIYLEICKLLVEDPEWVRGWDDVGLVPYMYSHDQWVGYEDSASLQIKMDYIRDMGLLGAMTWAIDQDDYLGHCGQGLNPLMKVLYEGMKDYIVPAEPPTPSLTTPAPPAHTTAPVPVTTPAPITLPPGEVDCSLSQFWPHEDCNKYYWCYNGDPHLEFCNPGLFWNQDCQCCDWPENIDTSKCNMVLKTPAGDAARKHPAVKKTEAGPPQNTVLRHVDQEPEQDVRHASPLSLAKKLAQKETPIAKTPSIRASPKKSVKKS